MHHGCAFFHSRRTDSRPSPRRLIPQFRYQKVSVQDSKSDQPADGSRNVGYRVDTVTDIGPFSNMKIQDTPYSYNIISSDFIENTQSFTTPGAGVLDKSPFYAYTYKRSAWKSSTREANAESLAPRLTISTASTALPPHPRHRPTAWNSTTRIEVMSGVSGFMYGVDSNSGFLNYVIKRPTPMPYESLTVGAPDVESGYVHVDIGRPHQGIRIWVSQSMWSTKEATAPSSTRVHIAIWSAGHSTIGPPIAFSCRSMLRVRSFGRVACPPIWKQRFFQD